MTSNTQIDFPAAVAASHCHLFCPLARNALLRAMKAVIFGSLLLVALIFSPDLHAQTLTKGTATTSAANLSGTWSTFSNFVYQEAASGNVSTGTIIFTAPAGHEFRASGGNDPRIRISGGSGGISATASFGSRSATQIIFNVTRVSSGGRLNTFTIDRIQIQPTVGLGIGVTEIPNAGTAVFAGTTNNVTAFLEVTKTAAAVNKLAFFQQPTSTSAGVSFTPNITVEIQDTYGNRTTSTASVTLAIQTNPAGGVLNNVTAVAGVSGLATFTARSIDKGGTGYVLRASSGALITADSTAFNINNPVPTTTSISPDTKAAGSALFTMTVNGTNFISTSQVRLGAANRTTTFVSATQLTVEIPASDMLIANTYNVDVVNGAPGGGTSNAQTFTVTGSPPTLTSISPASVEAGGAAFSLTATGTNFTSNTTIMFNGVARATVGVPSATQITATILDTDIATAGTHNITVFNPDPGGGTTTAQVLTVITTPSKLLFSVQPNSTTANTTISPAVTVKVTNLNDVTVTSASNTITLALGSNPGPSILTGTTAVAASSGIASFGNLKLNVNGDGYTLIATSPGLTSVASATFNIGDLVCYTDQFSTLANWSVGNEGGAFGNPVSFNNGGGAFSMRMTNNTTNSSTYATLNRLFPGAGNKVVVEFNLYAYNGTGADGIAVTLSDASVAPVAGAFGGSLGYAPKLIASGGEVNHAGFAGGWIGVGLDAFGNFSNNAEGRTGGTAPGVRADAVAIRGSGSGYNGYGYLAGTATLSPGIDNAGSTTPAPGHRYRVIVDHTSGTQALTSVERDTGGTGSSYAFLISPFDAKADANQAPVPTNWLLSFTGATGGSTNIHEIRNLSVCSPTQQLITLDHIRLEYSATGQTCGGGVTPITVKACANAACDALFVGSVTVNLSATGTNTSLSSSSVTFTGGQTSVNLIKTSAGTVQMGATLPAPNASVPVACFTGGGETPCATTLITYTASDACFNATEPNEAPGSRILTKLAATGFNIDVMAVSGGTVNTGFTTAVDNSNNVRVSLVNPLASSGNCSDAAIGLTAETSLAYVAGNAGRRTVTFNYPSAAQNIRVRIRDNSGSTCSSDDFSIRPYGFSAVGPVDAVRKAGASTFNVSTTAVLGDGTTNVPFYYGTPRVDTALLTGSTNVGTLATSPTPTTPPTFQTAAIAGCTAPCSASGTFTYNQVGTVTFPVLSIYDDVWVDHDIANGDCNNNYSNVLASGRYGCKFANLNQLVVSRFTPAYFGTVLTGPMVCTGLTFSPACPAGGLAYAGQPFTTVVTAYLTGGAVATNYTGSNAKNVTLSVCDTPGCTTSPPTTFPGQLVQPIIAPAVVAGPIPPASFTNGVATMTATSVVGSAPSFNFTTTTTAPTTIYVRAVDTDNVTSLNSITPASSIEGGVKIVSGRVRILNAYGSELLDLPMSMRAEYWVADNQGWVIFPNDRTNVAIQPLVPALTCVNEGAATNTSGQACATVSGITSRYFRESPVTTPTDTPNPLFDGNFNLWLRAPGTRTSVDVTADVPVWLQYKWRNNVLSNPTGRATFGVVRSGRVIYRQEMYR